MLSFFDPLFGVCFFYIQSIALKCELIRGNCTIILYLPFLGNAYHALLVPGNQGLLVFCVITALSCYFIAAYNILSSFDAVL